MRAILRGKVNERKPLSIRARKVIAILVAAALLLTSCAIIYRNEIRGFIENVTEYFTRLSHSDETTDGNSIEEIYEFTYVPDGFTFEKSSLNPLSNNSIYRNSNDDVISFNQSVLDSTSFFIDEEYTAILVVNTYDVYYKTTDGCHFYLWSDGKYAMRIDSNKEISDDEIIQIVDGIRSK